MMTTTTKQSAAVEKAIQIMTDAVAEFDKRKQECIKHMKTMTKDERNEWFGHMTEKLPRLKNLWERMILAAEAGLEDAAHVYSNQERFPANRIRFATKRALESIRNPDEVVPVARKDGVVVKKRVGDLNKDEVRRAWDNKTGFISVRTQKRRLEKKLTKKPVEALGIKSAALDGATVLLTVAGYSDPVRLTKKDIKMLADMIGV